MNFDILDELDAIVPEVVVRPTEKEIVEDIDKEVDEIFDQLTLYDSAYIPLGRAENMRLVPLNSDEYKEYTKSLTNQEKDVTLCPEKESFSARAKSWFGVTK